ncbi:FAD/NAD(P)-binding domain-containing protein [Phanerochaete sordida]|uniref:FAD/NAD(P)-binding domain-containing protein n=1 Tax=Phanerochaete sordida TaxID=48140 RepID=A0A9P3FX43_9APHY|nr:FAD/NAD(P)-binding domain-containing protein [Phanerochaete sordida]
MKQRDLKVSSSAIGHLSLEYHHLLAAMDLDVVVLGTGLTESIVAAALSKAGFKVGHVDANPYYGGDDASLSIDELVSWADERASGNVQSSAYLDNQRKRFTDISYTGAVPSQSRQYAVSLCPTIIPSIGPLIESLIASGVSRYGGFKLLEQVALYESAGVAKPVPGNKEDVFKDKQLSLLQKRRLMRFLMFAGGDFEDKPELQTLEHTPFPAFLKDKFSLDDEAIRAITYALAFCVSHGDPTLPALHRIRRYLRSTGRYGPSPFLVGHYGGIGELAQGFCRTAAVAGATYILGRPIVSIERQESSGVGQKQYTIQLGDVTEAVTCDVLISSHDYASFLPSSSASAVTPLPSTGHVDCTWARCVAVLDRPLSFSALRQDHEGSDETSQGESKDENGEPPTPSKKEVDTAVLVFPPWSVPTGSQSTAVHVLVTGEASMSSPKGKYILNISMPLVEEGLGQRSAEELLQPFLEATLTLCQSEPVQEGSPSAVQPLFTLYYQQHPYSKSSPGDNPPDSSPLLSEPLDSAHLPEIADGMTTSAEVTFWRALELLKAAGCKPQRKSEDGEADSQDAPEIDSLWPPLEFVQEDEEEW